MQHLGLDVEAQPRQASEPLVSAPLRRPHPTPKPPPPPGRISAAREAVRSFLVAECQAREVRITKISPVPGGEGGWDAQAEILVPDLTIKMLGLPLTQEVLEREYCAIELDPVLSVKSYEFVDPSDR